MSRAWAVGVFVGGQGRRMGGLPKGLLRVGGETLLGRTVRLINQATGDDAEIVLVGDAQAYRSFALPTVADDPPHIGPLGGLQSLLRLAHARGVPAVALSVDLPYFPVQLLARLLREAPGAAVLAPHEEGHWQPLFARYEPALALPVVQRVLASGERALWRVLSQAGQGAERLQLTPQERSWLKDWDTPADLGG